MLIRDHRLTAGFNSSSWQFSTSAAPVYVSQQISPNVSNDLAASYYSNYNAL